jgi:hypothetical protein
VGEAAGGLPGAARVSGAEMRAERARREVKNFMVMVMAVRLVAVVCCWSEMRYKFEMQSLECLMLGWG